MKRIMLLLAAAVLLLCACSGNSAATDKSPEEIAQAILSNTEFRDDLIKAEGDVAENYYKLTDAVSEHAIYISGSGATAEEVAVLKTADAKTIEDAKAILNARVEEQIFRYEDYIPAEMVKLKAPVIVTKGNIAVLVLADDAEAAGKAAEDALK